MYVAPMAISLMNGAFCVCNARWNGKHRRTTPSGVKDLLGNAPGKSRGDIKARLQTFMKVNIPARFSDAPNIEFDFHQQDVKTKEAQALNVKNQFQDVVDRLRTFWANVEAALANPWMEAARNIAVENLGARIATLTKQLEA